MKRIQRKRTKGWRMPEGAMYVGRPTPWGNPFRTLRWQIVAGDGTVTKTNVSRKLKPDEAVNCFRAELGRWDSGYRAFYLGPLREATALVCWCPLDQPCHADVLIEALEVGAS